MNLDAMLALLEDAMLIRRVDESDRTYIFKHTLTHETVYQSLLKTQRRRLHRDVAATIEQAFPSQVESLSDVLAYHWEEGEVPERARYYLFLTGQRAAHRYAYQEALVLYGRALASADAPPEEIMAIRAARAEIFEFLSQYGQAMLDYEAALPLARRANRPADECRIMSRIAWLHWLSGKGAEAVEMAMETEEKARALQDRSVALRAYLVAGLVAQAEGGLSEAYPRLRQALFISRASDERALEGESLFFLGVQNNFMGRFGRAAACAQKAYAIKKSLGDRVGEIVSLYLKARAQGGRGNYDAALETLEAGRAVAEEIQNPFGLAQYPNTRAWLCAELGDWQTAYAIDRAGLETARAAPVRPPEISTLINLVLDCTSLGRLDEAEGCLRELHQWIGRPEFGFHAWRWQTRLADARARLLLAQSRDGDAPQAIEELLKWAYRTQSRKYRARGLLLQARVHLAHNALTAAEACYITACETADCMGYFPVRLEARRGLVAVYERTGADAKGAQQRAQIAELIADLDGQIRHPDLRQSFERGILRGSHPASTRELPGQPR